MVPAPSRHQQERQARQKNINSNGLKQQHQPSEQHTNTSDPEKRRIRPQCSAKTSRMEGNGRHDQSTDRTDGAGGVSTSHPEPNLHYAMAVSRATDAGTGLGGPEARQATWPEHNHRDPTCNRKGGNISSLAKAVTRPRVTYGKKGTDLLSLTARQFKSSNYGINSNEEDVEPSPQYLMAGGLGCDSGDEGDQSKQGDDGDLEDDVVHILHSTAAGGRARNKHISVGKGDDAPSLGLDTTANRKIGPCDAPPKKIQQTNRGGGATKAGKPITKEHPVAPTRRLPVNELLLVASLPEYPRVDPASSYPGVATQDPIENYSSSPRKRQISSQGSDDEADNRRATKTPLTAIRKRIKTAKCRFKRLAPPKHKTGETGLDLMKDERTEPRGRDGFDQAELAIRSRPTLRRKPKMQTPLLRKFDALQLCSGPLPDVEFETPIKLELQTQVGIGDDMPVYDAADEQYHQTLPENASQSLSRRVSFLDRVREAKIRAELSSISAPARVPSESGDSDEDIEDDEELEDDEDADGDEPAFNEGDESAVVHENENVPRENEGVTLDFRRPELLGQTNVARSLQRRNLMEVNERILEVPGTSPTRRRSNRPSEQVRGSNQGPRRLPSILKNSTPIIPDSTSRPEHTEANTRRNSFVEVEESRYFAGAVENLRDFDPARHTVIPRRRPSYFDLGEVQVPDSDHVVPETSPGRLHYANEPQLNVVRRTSEAVWTSSADTNGARDLKILTRSVSREHGTLSQSVRRRPSLPFQSPTKVL